MGGLIGRLRRVLVMDVDLSVVCVVFWSWTWTYQSFASCFGHGRRLISRLRRFCSELSNSYWAFGGFWWGLERGFAG